MSYIHYVDIKSNEQRQQEIAGLRPCFQACLLVVCLLLDVKHKGHN
jgi:hypothetical protein